MKDIRIKQGSRDRQQVVLAKCGCVLPCFLCQSRMRIHTKMLGKCPTSVGLYKGVVPCMACLVAIVQVQCTSYIGHFSEWCIFCVEVLELCGCTAQKHRALQATLRLKIRGRGNLLCMGLWGMYSFS